MSPDDRCLQVKTARDSTVIELLADRLDEWNAEALGKELTDLVAHLGAHPLQLDFDRVEYISSTGLAKIVDLSKAVRTAGGQLALTNLNRHVYEVFEVTQLTKILDLQAKHPAPIASACTSV
jgi:anti-anti-sigma factor